MVPFRFSLMFFTSFFVTLRRPPRPSLFPYTTLFRSSTPSSDTSIHFSKNTLHNTRSACAFDARCAQKTPRVGSPRGKRFRIDRKSTRLNSSHLVISYAVFCLKKKRILYYIRIRLLKN